MSGQTISFQWPIYVMFAVKADQSYEPYITQGDNFEFWVHVELDEGRSQITAWEFKKYRESGKCLIEGDIGSMSVPVNSLMELKAFTNQLSMKTAGFMYNLKIDEKTGVFEGIYIRWKNFHGSAT